MLAGFAVENSGWKLNGVPAQLAIEVFWNPLAAEACMKPLVCRRQVVDNHLEGFTTAWRSCIRHVDRDPVARVHEQGLRCSA